MKQKTPNIKIIAKNKKAFFEYLIEEKIEAGLVLTGSEVKSLRDGRANLVDSYAMIKEGEVFLIHAHIAPYPPAAYLNHEPRRTRKLLLQREQISKLERKLNEKGLTLVPTMLYFKSGRAKIELGLARGKKTFDKRAAIEKRESDRHIERAMKRKNR